MQPPIDPRIIQQLKQQQQQAQKQQKPTEETRAKAREEKNPLPPGIEGIRILRYLTDCAIPEETEQIKKLLEKYSVASNITLEECEKIAPVLGTGLASTILADKYCAHYKTTRPAVRFQDDEELKETNEQIQQLKNRLDQLQQDLIETSQNLQKATAKRWDTAVNKFGLAPEKYSYELDEKEGIIYLVDLDCSKCHANTKIRKARQALAEQLLKLEKRNKETSND